MKPTFRESANRQLSGITFSDEMKLQVLIQARRKHHSQRMLYTAVASIIFLVIISIGTVMAFKPKDDVTAVAPANEVYDVFSSDNFDVIVTRVSHKNDTVNIDFTIVSRADYDVILMRLPIYDANTKTNRQATIDEISCTPSFPVSGQQVIYMAAGSKCNFSITLEISDHKPDQDIVLAAKFDILKPAVEIVGQDKLAKLTPAHPGPFLVRIDDIHLDPILKLETNTEYNPSEEGSWMYAICDWPYDGWSGVGDYERQRWIGQTAVSTGLALPDREYIKLEIILR